MSISRRNFLRGVGIGCSACAIGKVRISGEILLG
ncbi:MAG: twin-arginine translocation signal domain-containing protein [Gammaproteobacteria bacterium]|nr:twin-arginine translocation signal domain-containing protein [Gammaproteobacteria bacterium]